MNAKTFSQRFNRELASFGLPEDINEKTKAVAKVFQVTRHMANAMLFGHAIPELPKLDAIARTLEVCPEWLSGKSEKRKGYVPMNISEEA
jgi:hypothetical protein